MNRFNEGDIVKMSKTSRYWNSTNESNPKHIEGYITIVSSDGTRVKVRWNNGTNNAYYSDGLRLVRRG